MTPVRTRILTGQAVDHWPPSRFEICLSIVEAVWRSVEKREGAVLLWESPTFPLLNENLMDTTSQRIRTIDLRGRLTLGKSEAGRTVMVEDTDDRFSVRYCRAVPERELWLYANDAALSLVTQGQQEIASGKALRDVDLSSVFALADSMPDDDK